jgi:AcrR family transcriptional regulator
MAGPQSLGYDHPVNVGSAASRRPDFEGSNVRSAAPTEKGARQIETILAATLRTIATHGYAATSLARIAAEAGTTKRMVLYYFESRDQLFTELVHRITAQMVEQSKAGFDAESDPSDGVRRSARLLWDRVVGDPVLVHAYFAVLGEAGANTALRNLLDHVRAAHLEVVQLHLERARALGIVPPVDPDVLSTLMFAGFRGLLLEFYERGPSPALDGALAIFEASLSAAFQARPA